MSRLRLTVLYEVDHQFRPHSSPHVRFLRPLSHPTVAEQIDARFARDYGGQPADAVILDRLWGPRLTPLTAASLLRRVRQGGAKLLYSLDDNLLDLGAERGDWPTPQQVALIEHLLAEAHGVLVSTEPLRDRVAGYNANVAVVPNALDERLMVGDRLPQLPSPFEARPPVVIGLMGTLTHDQDLQMVLPALAEVVDRHDGAVRLECVGAVGDADAVEGLASLPIRFFGPAADEGEYPLFMLWFTSAVRWDIALAPLMDTPFNRCKSDLKYLDYAAVGAAGIYSRVAPYLAGVRHLETGWLAENTAAAWVKAIETLVADAELRGRLAAAAQADLLGHRTLAHRAGDWVAAIRQLLGATTPAEEEAAAPTQRTTEAQP